MKISKLSTNYYLSWAFSILFVLQNTIATAQKKNADWTREMYQQVSLENFRKEKCFKAKVETENIDYPRLNACLFYLTNEVRQENNLKLLSYSAALEIAAWHHSRAMVEDDFFGHINPKDQARDSQEKRAKLAGIKNPLLTENIAMLSFSSAKKSYLELAESIVEQWMEIESSQENILSEEALQLGCGIYISQRRCYATQCLQKNQLIQIAQAKDILP